MERRRGKRTRQRVLCEFSAHGQAHRGLVVDLSPNGLFIHTDASVKPGADVEVRLTSFGAHPELVLRGEVARRRIIPALLASVIRSGIGVRIREAPDEYYATLGEDGPPDETVSTAHGAFPADDSAELAVDSADDFDDATEPFQTPLPSADPGASEYESAGADEALETERAVEPPSMEPDSQDGESNPDVPAAVRAPVPSIVSAPDGRGWVSPALPEPSLAIVIDDGELDDVETLLDELGANPVRHRLRDPTGFRGWEQPPRLFVAAARSALSIQIPASAASQGVVSIAVGEDDSQTMCALMQRQGFQYVVRRPVHPEALRLLFLRALYRKSDKRREPRFPFGYEVTWWLHWRRWRGPLVELSPSGCRVLAPDRQIEPGTRLNVKIPREAADGQSLSLPGTVVRVESKRSRGRRRHFALAIEFAKLESRTRERLGALLAARSIGPATLPRDHEPIANHSVIERDPEAVSPRDRRSHPRGAFQQEVVSLEADAERVMHVLVGRDLSVGGIRVEPHPILAVGDRLRLAIYDATRPAPIIVEAVAIRDDSEHGLAMRFVDVEPAMAQHIEHIVGTLPAVEALRGADSEAVFITDILEKRDPA
jgi:hypothetical protein